MSARIFSAFAALALASLACGINIDLPDRPTPGPEVTYPLNVAVPGAGVTQLQLDFNAGELEVTPGAGAEVLRGTATFNLPELQPEVSVSGTSVRVKQGNFELDNIPDYRNVKNHWQVQLGDAPIDLSVNGGAYKATYELGGLALPSLYIKDGAANVELSFNAPNRTEMGILRYETGASKVELTGLANANFHTLVFDGGAGTYTLDFSGELKRDATITLRAGFSNLVLRIPPNVNATVIVDGGLSNVSMTGSWDKTGNRYVQIGSGPKLDFIVDMGAGFLKLAD